MKIKVTGKIKLFLLLCAFILPLFLLDVCADEERSQVEEKAIKGAKTEDITSLDYRQKLGQPIVIQEEYFPHELDTYVRFMPSTGSESQSGRVGLITSASEYNYQIKAFDKLPIEFAVISKYIGINNSTAVKLPAKLTATSFGAEATLPFFNFDKTYFTIGLAPSFFSDNWNFNSSTFSLAQRYFLIYQPNEKLTFVGGVTYIPGFRPSIDPIIGFIYKPNDRLTFNLTPNNPEISYDLNSRWTIFAQGDDTSEEYKVKQGDLKNLVLKYDEMRLGGGLRCSVNKHIKASLSVGSVFNRTIRYKENNLGKVALDNGFYSEFRFDIVM